MAVDEFAVIENEDIESRHTKEPAKRYLKRFLRMTCRCMASYSIMALKSESLLDELILKQKNNEGWDIALLTGN